MCYPSLSKPFSKFSQSQPSPGKTEQNKSKEKAWIRLSGMSLFNGLGRPFGKKMFSRCFTAIGHREPGRDLAGDQAKLP